MGLIALLLGCLIPTFLVSRLLLWITRSWEGGVTRIAVVHFFSWVIAGFLGGMGMADGGAFAGVEAAALYALPQAFWLFADVLYYRRKSRIVMKAAQISD